MIRRCSIPPYRSRDICLSGTLSRMSRLRELPIAYKPARLYRLPFTRWHDRVVVPYDRRTHTHRTSGRLCPPAGSNYRLPTDSVVCTGCRLRGRLGHVPTYGHCLRPTPNCCLSQSLDYKSKVLDLTAEYGRATLPALAGTTNCVQTRPCLPYTASRSVGHMSLPTMTVLITGFNPS